MTGSPMAAIGSAIIVFLLALGTVPAGAQDVHRWSFESELETLGAKLVGGVERGPGPMPADFPSFTTNNLALHLPRHGSRIEFAVPADGKSRFDVGGGESITLEAWVWPSGDGGEHQYVIGKGRTEAGSSNQNYALRLSKGAPNFLFRSQNNTWHRWTGLETANKAQWNHIAVVYTFGQADSLEGWLNGRRIKGIWDMDGKTDDAPVQDDDDLWIGAAQGGANGFVGFLDEIVLHRRRVDPSTLRVKGLFKAGPPVTRGADLAETDWAALPEGRVRVAFTEGVPSLKTFPASSPMRPVALVYTNEVFASSRLPAKFDSRGVRDDWKGPVHLVMFGKVRLPAGEHQILVRHRGLARVQVDGETLITTPPLAGNSDKDELPIPDAIQAGIRLPRAGDIERSGSFVSTGGVHRIVFELITGGSGKYPMDIGDSCVAWSAFGAKRFHMLGGAAGESDAAKNALPLTEAGWRQFVEQERAMIDALDRRNRRAKAASEMAFWATRHEHARTYAKNAPSMQIVVPKPVPGWPANNPIDRFIAAKATGQGGATADAPAASTYYAETIQPLLDQHCFRCHGDKEKGGLNLRERAKALAGGESGDPAVVPGHPEQSRLIEAITSDDEDLQMPPKGDRLSAADVAVLRKWITDGADMTPAAIVVTSPPPLASAQVLRRREQLRLTGRIPALGQTEIDDRTAPQVAYWQDVLGENVRMIKGTLNNTGPFRHFIHDSIADNKPADRFVTELVMMRGGLRAGGPAGFGEASQNDVPPAAKAHVLGTAFLGLELKCARCHDAPYHDYLQRDLFEMAAMLNRNPIKVPKTSSVPAAFFEQHGGRHSLIEVTLSAGSSVQAAWPFPNLNTACPPELLRDPKDSRERLAAFITLPENERFAHVMVNRLWKRWFGRGVVEPAHDWEHAGMPGQTSAIPAHATHPELLRWLARELLLNNYDLQHIEQLIRRSRAYQSVAIAPDDKTAHLFLGPLQRRMSAEELVDSMYVAALKQMEWQTEEININLTGRQKNDFTNFGRPQRAWQFGSVATNRDRPSLVMPLAQMHIDVLETWGWRSDRSEPLTERPNAVINMRQQAVVANSTLMTWLTRVTDEMPHAWGAFEADATVADVVDRMYEHILGRPPSPAEREEAEALLGSGFASRLTGNPANPPRSTTRYLTWFNHLHPSATPRAMAEQAAVLAGPMPTARLKTAWRERLEDLLWSLLNSPEFYLVR